MVDPELQALLDGILKPNAGKASFDVAAARAGAARLSAELAGPLVEVGRIRDEEVPGNAGIVRVRVYEPARTPRPGATIVYFHGGGWVTGDLDSFDATCRALCAGSGATVVNVDYRRSPEHRFPAPLDDCLTAARWAMANAQVIGGDAARVAIAGDSVGGGMAAIVTRRLVAEGLKPALHVLLYPATDATMKEASYASFGGGDFYVSTATMAAYYDAYLGEGGDRLSPDVSALFASDIEIATLPPVIIMVAGNDPLQDEARAYAAKLEAAGVAVERIEVPGAIHAFLRFRVAALARQAMADVALLAAARLAKPHNAGTSAVVSMIRAKPGQAEALVSICVALGDLSIAEARCRSYTFHQAPADPGLFVFYEAFDAAADLQAHLDAPHTQAWFARVKALAADPEITRLTVVTEPPAAARQV